jgi:hypothetical protein
MNVFLHVERTEQVAEVVTFLTFIWEVSVRILVGTPTALIEDCVPLSPSSPILG